MSHSKSAASRWFRASEATGDFMGIRYGRSAPGSSEPEWIFVSHCDCDGIGGFARLLRERGAELPELPKTGSPCRGLLGPLWRLVCDSFGAGECADRGDWARPGAQGANGQVAWHLFTEAETTELLARCRREGVTVNSLLLKHLDQAIRPGILRPHLEIPWMIPVNLRGDISLADDTENHVSCVVARVAADDSAAAIQRKIRHRLQLGEHRASHLILNSTGFLSHRAMVKFLAKDRARPAGNIGSFSNLGAWDADKRIAAEDGWLFCPPVVKGQLLGAGCVTFQNRLALTIQPHPDLASPPDIAESWMGRWIQGL